MEDSLNEAWFRSSIRYHIHVPVSHVSAAQVEREILPVEASQGEGSLARDYQAWKDYRDEMADAGSVTKEI